MRQSPTFWPAPLRAVRAFECRTCGLFQNGWLTHAGTRWHSRTTRPHCHRCQTSAASSVWRAIKAGVLPRADGFCAPTAANRRTVTTIATTPSRSPSSLYAVHATGIAAQQRGCLFTVRFYQKKPPDVLPPARIPGRHRVRLRAEHDPSTSQRRPRCNRAPARELGRLMSSLARSPATEPTMGAVSCSQIRAGNCATRNAGLHNRCAQ